MSTSTSTVNGEVMLRRVFDEVVGNGNFDLIDELVAPTYVNHSMPQAGSGAEGVRNTMGMFRAAFPDIRVELDDVIEQGDRVASRGSFVGTHQGDFMGIPATGRSVRVQFIDIWRIEDGKFVENWVQMDMLGLMQQLGVAG